MITLFLHLAFFDVPDLVLQRIAPQLPIGMAWHPGMRFLDVVDVNDGYEVGCVYVDHLGNGSVHFFVEQDCNCTPEVFAEFEAVGWQVVES